MSGIIFDIKRFAIHDGPGIRTSIFFKGCPLSCWWCHNPESCALGIQHVDFDFKGSRIIGKKMSSKELLKEIEKDRDFFEESGGGVTFTGGEPLLQSDFLQEVAALLKGADYHLALDTTAYASPQVFSKSVELMDLVLFDIKHMNEAKHFEYTGVSNKPIFKNLEYLIENDKPIHIRFPMIPGFNDDVIHLKLMTDYLKSLKKIERIHLLPYHKIAAGKYEKLGIENKMNGIEEPSENMIQEVKNYFLSRGFDVRIG